MKRRLEDRRDGGMEREEGREGGKEGEKERGREERRK